MSELTWRAAIIHVLQSQPEPMHYIDIAEAIAERKLRTELSTAPAANVNSVIRYSMRMEGVDSPFRRTGIGRYSLNVAPATPQPQDTETASLLLPVKEPGLINAFGRYWSRTSVLWTPTPRILGQQLPGDAPVDFGAQIGVYLLHDGSSVVYVGCTTEQALGASLRQHLSDWPHGRWDRFSWFGVSPATSADVLATPAMVACTIEMLVTTLQAILIRGLNPPQHDERVDDFRATEFLQVEDPEIQPCIPVTVNGATPGGLIKQVDP